MLPSGLNQRHVATNRGSLRHRYAVGEFDRLNLGEWNEQEPSFSMSCRFLLAGFQLSLIGRFWVSPEAGVPSEFSQCLVIKGCCARNGESTASSRNVCRRMLYRPGDSSRASIVCRVAGWDILARRSRKCFLNRAASFFRLLLRSTVAYCDMADNVRG
jgi:hypothetical protein